MALIEVDWDVYKTLTVKRTTEDMTYNDVLRNLLKLGPATKVHQTTTALSGGWTGKGHSFAADTQLRAIYKGKVYEAMIADGGIQFNGELYASPSAAAIAVTQNNVNGWRFWQLQKDGTWITLDDYLKQRP